MTRDVEVEDTPTVVTDEEEAVQETEGDRGHREQVHGSNGFPVIAKKSEPTPCGLRVSWRLPHPARDRSLGHVKPKHYQFAVNARRTPSRILGDYLKDQVPDLPGQRLPPHSPPRSGDQTPAQAEAGAMPMQHGLGCNHHQSILPPRPKPTREYPEKLVNRPESQSRMATVEDRELLPKG